MIMFPIYCKKYAIFLSGRERSSKNKTCKEIETKEVTKSKSECVCLH